MVGTGGGGGGGGGEVCTFTCWLMRDDGVVCKLVRSRVMRLTFEFLLAGVVRDIWMNR